MKNGDTFDYCFYKRLFPDERRQISRIGTRLAVHENSVPGHKFKTKSSFLCPGILRRFLRGGFCFLDLVIYHSQIERAWLTGRYSYCFFFAKGTFIRTGIRYCVIKHLEYSFQLCLFPKISAFFILEDFLSTVNSQSGWNILKDHTETCIVEVQEHHGKQKQNGGSIFQTYLSLESPSSTTGGDIQMHPPSFL